MGSQSPEPKYQDHIYSSLCRITELQYWSNPLSQISCSNYFFCELSDTISFGPLHQNIHICSSNRKTNILSSKKYTGRMALSLFLCNSLGPTVLGGWLYAQAFIMTAVVVPHPGHMPIPKPVVGKDLLRSQGWNHLSLCHRRIDTLTKSGPCLHGRWGVECWQTTNSVSSRP